MAGKHCEKNRKICSEIILNTTKKKTLFGVIQLENVFIPVIIMSVSVRLKKYFTLPELKYF